MKEMVKLVKSGMQQQQFPNQFRRTEMSGKISISFPNLRIEIRKGVEYVNGDSKETDEIIVHVHGDEGEVLFASDKGIPGITGPVIQLRASEAFQRERKRLEEKHRPPNFASPYGSGPKSTESQQGGS